MNFSSRDIASSRRPVGVQRSLGYPASISSCIPLWRDQSLELLALRGDTLCTSVFYSSLGMCFPASIHALKDNASFSYWHAFPSEMHPTDCRSLSQETDGQDVRMTGYRNDGTLAGLLVCRQKLNNRKRGVSLNESFHSISSHTHHGFYWTPIPSIHRSFGHYSKTERCLYHGLSKLHRSRCGAASTGSKCSGARGWRNRGTATILGNEKGCTPNMRVSSSSSKVFTGRWRSSWNGWARL